MKFFILLFFSFFSFFNIVIGQGFSKIEGLVLEKGTNLPVQHCYVGVSSKGIGTIANAEGNFIFKFPAILKKEKVTISALGFLNATYDLSDSTLIDVDTFYVERKPLVILDTAYTNHQNPKWTVADALLRVKTNAQMNNYMLNGFYQETLFRDSMFVKVYEGLLKVEKNPTPPQKIPEDFMAEKVKLLKGRRYEKADYTEELKDFGFGNGPAIVTHSMEISLPEYFEGRNFDDYQFKLDSVMSTFDDKPLWIFHFMPAQNRKVKAAREGEIFIDTLSKAIVRIEYNFTPEGTKDVVKGTLKNVLGGLKTDVKRVYGAYQYKSFLDKYYLMDSQLALDATIKKGKDFSTEASIRLHFISNEILSKYSAFKSTDVLESVDDFPLGGRRYEDLIWGNFNFKKPIIEMRKIIVLEE